MRQPAGYVISAKVGEPPELDGLTLMPDSLAPRWHTHAEVAAKVEAYAIRDTSKRFSFVTSSIPPYIEQDGKYMPNPEYSAAQFTIYLYAATPRR